MLDRDTNTVEMKPDPQQKDPAWIVACKLQEISSPTIPVHFMTRTTPTVIQCSHTFGCVIGVVLCFFTSTSL